MKNILIFLISTITLTTSCSEDDIGKQTDSDGIIISLPYQWKRSLHENGVASNGTIRFPVYYKNNIGIPTTNGKDNRFLTLINSTNGETLWQWNDSYLPYSSQIKIFYHYQYNNLLTYTDGGATYCINLDNGATHWNIIRNVSFHSKVSGFDNNYFTFGESESKYLEYQEKIGYKGNLETGEIEEYIIPNFTLEHIVGNRIGDVTRIEPYLFNGVQHLAITWQELTDDTLWNFQTYLGLYNYETNEHILNTDVIDIDDGHVVLNNDLFKDIPNLSIVHLILLRGNVVIEEIEGELYKFYAESHVRLPIILAKDLTTVAKE